MTDREIRHLSKTELLSIIRDQEQELQQMKEKTEKLEHQLSDKRIGLKKCGSIAEASLQVNRVFEDAQSAADQYLSEVKERRDKAGTEADRILAEAKEKADAQIHASMETGKKLEDEGRRKSDACWTALQGKLDTFYESRQGLKEMLTSCGVDVQAAIAGVKRGNDKSGDSAAESGGSEPGAGKQK